MEKIEITQSDIAMMQTVIDLAVQKGVFRAADMIAIGSLFEKLQKISQSLSPQTTEQK
jgi:hypothetical protein